jgi:hypothetical protein
VADAAGMVAALDAVLDSERRCLVTLPVDLDPLRTTGQVLFQTWVMEGIHLMEPVYEHLSQNDPDGWRIRDPRHLELLGDACATAGTEERILFVDVASTVTPGS